MHVAIAGAGKVGQYLAADLSVRGHEVLVIEKEEDVAARAEPVEGVTWHIADACEVSALREAKLELADVVVATTGDDEDNLVISLLAKQEFAVPRVIARVNHPGNAWLFTPAWGVDVAVSTPSLVTALVEEAVTVGDLVRLLNLEGGQIRLVEVTLAEDSPAVDRTIVDLDLSREVIFVAIIRNERVIHPRGQTSLYAGDEVLALATPATEDEFRQKLIGD